MLRQKTWFLMTTILLTIALTLGACAGTETAGQAEATPAETAEEEAQAPAEEAEAEEEAADAEPEPAEMAEGEEEAQTDAEPADGQLEIFSWWTAGGEAEALQAVYDLYLEEYPNVEIINAALAGGAGANARAVLSTRMESGDPPDSFQVHAGHELIDTWVVADRMEPVTFLFDENEWREVYPEGVIDIISHEGEIWSVPIDIHRSNVLWYNVDVFEENDLEPPQTLDEFFQVADELQAAGVTPLALGDKNIWTATHLFESLLLAELGPEAYRGLWTGDTDWNSPEVTAALEDFVRMMDYVNEDHASLTWDQASQIVADGDAAMNVMGDWADGYFQSIDMEAEVDYGFVPSPDTTGSYMLLSDSFGLPQNAPHRENAVAWLELVGSREGQDAFNPIKGSIPARTDADTSLYNTYQQTALEDFQQDTLVPSVVHGAAASASWMTSLNDVMSFFVTDLDVEAAQQGLAQACVDAGVCQQQP